MTAAPCLARAQIETQPQIAPDAVPSISALVIKDPAEASDYTAALTAANPAEQGAALEAFAAKYPASRVKAEALERAMAAYLVARNLDKVEALSSRILADEPNNARALAMSVVVLRAKAVSAAPVQTAAQTTALAEQAGAVAEHGLVALERWRPQSGALEVDGAAVRTEMIAIFNGALGYRALTRKDYPSAKTYYLAAIKADPTGLDDIYQLAVSMLESDPVDPAGFWWAARAETLAVGAANPGAQTVIEAFAKPRYVHFHGGDEGWAALLTQAGSGLEPPAHFAVTPAPSAASVAVQAVHDAPLSALSFSDWEFILAQRDASPANKLAADKVWANISGLQAHGGRMKFQIKVIGVVANGVDGAITDDNQQTGHADLHVKLASPPIQALQAGSTVSVTGVLTGYTPSPFAFTMEQAELTGL